VGLTRKMGAIGLFGCVASPDYGGQGMDYLSYIIAVEEIARVDGSQAATVAADNSLGIGPLNDFGSEAQKQRYLPDLCAGRTLWGFGLTEPGFGSNPGGMTTRARKAGDEYILNGEKMWITSGTISDVAVVWAKVEGEGEGNDSIRGFLVETDRPGFSVQEIRGKWSLRFNHGRTRGPSLCR